MDYDSHLKRHASDLNESGLFIAADLFEKLNERYGRLSEPGKEFYSSLEVHQVQLEMINELTFALAEVEGLARGLDVTFEKRERDSIEEE